ncbi:o-succinylbenzoate synthase [Micromonospora sagamiensis]|uniref:o-succinylbenzoate synthase n=1 Tax=Micromonospora sagamiensis TaxID=47875 RepID=A0A562WGK3_9ACTN|nr:o-succinylbenzoate synthase [Micromonospora sagamiensis]TWJ29440.1 O-succinylbenzoate synthase [Micromonospora sagamiensis]BCL17531.1 o-succinylbenzoate synthase [Micromonospora sagamiensis]
MVTIDRVVLRLVRCTLTRPFENRWQRYHTWTKLVVEVDAGGVSGFAECAAMETPFYNYETIETAWYVSERYLVPALLRAGTTDPEQAQRAWADVNGHEEAKGGVEAALWDLRARLAGRPLCVELGGEVRRVPVGATAGIEPTIDELLANIGRIRDSGFQRVRIKIRPGWDVEPLRAIQAAFPGFPVVADANAAYDEEHLDALSGIDQFELMALEQPFARHLLETSAALQSRLVTPICLDEQVHSLREMVQAHRLKAGRQANIKIGRVGGLTEAVRIHDFCRAEGIDLFVGGKWEQGLDRWCALALATLPGMTLPSDVGPSRNYYLDDGVEPKLDVVEPGWAEPTDRPGLGADLTDTVEVTRIQEITKGVLV